MTAPKATRDARREADDGRAVWGFGKHKGAALNSDAGFARWVAAKQDFPADVRALAARGAKGEDVRRTT